MRVVVPLFVAAILAGCASASDHAATGVRAEAVDVTTPQGCLAAFIRPGTALAEDIAGLPEPPECSGEGFMTSLMAAGTPMADTGTAAGSFTRAITVTIVRSAEALPDFGRVMAEDRLGKDPAMRPIDVPGDTMVDGRRMALTGLASPDASDGAPLVCLYASDIGTGTTTAQICRSAEGRDDRAVRATVARILAEDLPAVRW